MWSISSVFVLLITSSLTAKVKWLPNASFGTPANFKDGKLPCSKQTVVFPDSIVGSIEIASGTEVNGFILPETGNLILDGTLTFGSDPSDDKCEVSNAYYLDKTSSAWNQADVWSSPKFNKATPDAERIPCHNDIVEFPKDVRINVQLPQENQYVKGLIINNETINYEDYFYAHALLQTTETQQFILNDNMGIGLKFNMPMPCINSLWCPCQINSLTIDCSEKFCPKTTCIHPVKPLGFCCEICGGFTVFDIDEKFDTLKLHELVENIIGHYRKDSLVYHIGFVQEVPVRRMQVVIVDKDEYGGSSAEAINDISYKIPQNWFKSDKLTEISGSPLSKSGLGVKIFVSMFFAVALTFGAIYLYYYKIPDIRFPLMCRGFGSAFPRYQRRSDSVVSLTRRDSVMTGRAAFRNPLYDSRRGRVMVTEYVVED